MLSQSVTGPAQDGDTLRTRFERGLMPAGIVMAFIAGGGYLALHYRGLSVRPDGTWLFQPLVHYVLSVLVIYRLLMRLWQRPGGSPGFSQWLEPVLLVTIGLGLLAPVVNALSRHAWDELVALQGLGNDGKMYRVWDESGSVQLKHDVPLTDMHIEGDETCNLVVAAALARVGFSPALLSEFSREDPENMTGYWMRRHLKGHPPGWAAMLSPMAHNPPTARVFQFVIYLLTTVAAFAAGTAYRGNRLDGLLTAAFFACLPDLIWFHAGRATADVAPALPSFLGIAIVLQCNRLWDSLTTGERTLRLLVAGLLFAAGTAITYTAAMAAAGSGLLLLWERGWKTFGNVVLLGTPGIAALLVCVWFSGASRADRTSVFEDRAHDLAADQAAEAAAGRKSAFGLERHTTRSFVTRFPGMVGPPVLILLSTSVLGYLLSKVSRRRQLAEAAAAICVVAPSIWAFWANLRYMFPGWMLVLIGAGIPGAWEGVSPRWRVFAVAVVAAFAVSKFTAMRCLA